VAAGLIQAKEMDPVSELASEPESTALVRMLPTSVSEEAS
jgi:hypothetical protein